MGRDRFDGQSSGLVGPAEGLLAVTPDDSTDLAVPSRGIMVGVAGDVAVTMSDGTEGTLPALQPGTIYPVRVTRVKATGTTATGIVGLY